MDQQFRDFFTKRNLISLLVLAIIILTIPIGVRLVRLQQELKTRAAGSAISFIPPGVETRTSASGSAILVATQSAVGVKLTPPVGWQLSSTPASGVPQAPIVTISSDSSCKSVSLNWNDVANETGYIVNRKKTADSTYLTVSGTLPANTTTYTDNLDISATSYDYLVKSLNDFGKSDRSNIVTAPVTPTTPSNLASGAVTKTTIALSWIDNSDNETGFVVNRKKTTDSTYLTVSGTLPANTTTYTDKNLAANTSYDYLVKSVNCSVKSDRSNLITVVTSK
ncbi:fibronectin type III domain-containing protein [Candidatus Daviesbacteria bacterium]|nr:fibronectin type III domain-containing protein [Candidatus Daviesbacteria bacterium]